MKDIFIFGCARSGKTILAKSIYEKFGYSIISIDSFVDAFEKAMPSVGIGHSNTEFKFKTLPIFIVKYYQKIKKEYPDVNFVIEGWHVFQKEIAKYIDLKDFVVIGIGYPKQDVNLKLKEIREFSYENDYCKKMTDERIINLVENHKNYSIQMQKECEELGINFFDISNNWDNVHKKIIEFIENSINVKS